MLKKIVMVTAATAGIALFAAPAAFAGTPHHGDYIHRGPVLVDAGHVLENVTVDTLNNDNVSVPVCVPDLDPAVAGIGGAVTAHEIPLAPTLPLNLVSETGDTTTTNHINHVGCVQHSDPSTSGNHVNNNR